jgi:hypothetical protein
MAAFNFAKRRHVRWQLGDEPTRSRQLAPARNAALDAAIIYVMRQGSEWARIVLAGGLSQTGECRDV